MSSGYLIYHGIRLARQVLGGVRESRAADRPLPGDNPLGITAAQVTAFSGALDRVLADMHARAQLPPHGFVEKGPNTVPEFSKQHQRNGSHWATRFLTCGFDESDRLHAGSSRVPGYSSPSAEHGGS
jgi:hypothetical protein